MTAATVGDITDLMFWGGVCTGIGIVCICVDIGIGVGSR